MAKQPKAPPAPDPAQQSPAPAPDPAPPGADQLAPLVARIAELEAALAKSDAPLVARIAELEAALAACDAERASAVAACRTLEAERDALKPHVRLRSFAFRLPETNERKIVRAPNLPAARAQLHPRSKFTGFVD